LNAPTGSLTLIFQTPDRDLYAYKPDRHIARGLGFLAGCVLLLALDVLIGARVPHWYGWLLGILPLFGGAVLGTWGIIDLRARALFHVEVDRRARTVSLASPSGKGHDLAKVGFGDVLSVELAEQPGPPKAWNVTLLLKNGRKIGLGLSAQAARAEELAGTFSKVTGAEITRRS